MRPDDLVAFARGLFELLPLQHPNASVPSRDEPAVLQRSHDERDRGTLHTEHDREKLLLQEKLFRADPILRLQQPPATPLLHAVQRVARRTLHDLQEIGLRVQRQDVVKRSRCGALFDKARDGHRRERTVRYLLERAARARPIAEEHADPEHAFDADRRDFNECAVTHLIRDREHTAIREIHVRDARAVRLERTSGHACVHVEMLLNTCVVNRWQRGEKPIVQRRAVRKKPRRSNG